MSRLISITAITQICLACALFAQNVSGNLDGIVLNEKGEPLQNVNIEIKGDALHAARGAVTNSQGIFRVPAVPVGTISVVLTHIAYTRVIYQSVEINLGVTTTLGEIRMSPRSISLGNVTVTGIQPAFDPNSTSIVSNIAFDEFETLPTQREYQAIVQLMPFANQSFLGDDVNIAGSTGQENVYFVDGMNTTDMYHAIGGTSLPYNFIKEIEVKTGGYEAEFGRATGGIVNVITHSGTNTFTAKAFGFFTDNRFAQDRKRGFVELATGDFGRYDAGISIGGPIVVDKAWFFVAYNGRVEKEDIAFQGLGIRTDNETTHTFAGKLTWRPTTQTNLLISIFGDPSTRDRIGINSVVPYTPDEIANPDPFLGRHKGGGVNISISGTHLFRNNLQLEFSASRHQAKQVAEAATSIGKTEPLLIDLTTGIWSGGYGEEWDRKSIRHAGSLVTTYFLNQHTLKWGLQYEDNTFEEDWRWDSDNGPHNAGQVIRQAENLYIALPLLPGQWQFTTRNRVISLFGQGSLALTNRFRLNLGLRWDGQYIIGLETKLTANILNQFQPRLGFVLQPDRIGRQKISGSFGRFYEELPARPLVGFVGGAYQDNVVYFHNPLLNPEGGTANPVVRPETRNLEPNLRGEHFDEYTLSYEKEISGKLKIGVRGMYRIVREIIQNSDDPVTGAGQGITGNPGRGILAHMPDPIRKYRGLAFTVESFGGRRVYFLSSLVISSSYGNYTGLFSSDSGLEIPNVGTQFDNPEQLINATGFLPNDRRYVFKLNGSYRFEFGLTAGILFSWQTGTPLSEFGAHPSPSKPSSYSFLRKRGTVGRTPSIWDLNLRFTYNLDRALGTKTHAKLVFDMFHLFSQRKAVNIEQAHFFSIDPVTGQQAGENPNYLKPLLFQPPLIVRIGFEVEI